MGSKGCGHTRQKLALGGVTLLGLFFDLSQISIDMGRSIQYNPGMAKAKDMHITDAIEGTAGWVITCTCGYMSREKFATRRLAYEDADQHLTEVYKDRPL